MRRNERPRPFEALAVEADGEPAVVLLLDQLVRPAVPDLDRAGAVVSRWDLAFEAPVLEGMVLDVNREMLCARLERHALRYGPRGGRTASRGSRRGPSPRVRE